jgi:hypothetical protein
MYGLFESLDGLTGGYLPPMVGLAFYVWITAEIAKAILIAGCDPARACCLWSGV